MAANALGAVLGERLQDEREKRVDDPVIVPDLIAAKYLDYWQATGLSLADFLDLLINEREMPTTQRSQRD